MKNVAEALEFVDGAQAAMARWSAQAGKPITCRGAGCFHCCKEPVWMDRREAVHILETMPAAQRAETTERARAWWDAFRAGGFMDMPNPREIKGKGSLLRYRAANLWCPLLKDGLCMVYERRPMSCRLHAAIGDPARCADDGERMTQVYCQGSRETEEMLALGMLQRLVGREPTIRLQHDHLGVWLAHLLLGEDERTQGGEDIEINFTQ